MAFLAQLQGHAATKQAEEEVYDSDLLKEQSAPRKRDAYGEWVSE